MKSIHKIDVGLDQVIVNRAQQNAKKEVREIQLSHQGPYGTGGMETEANVTERNTAEDRLRRK